jgi:type I restriction enzyme, S subunit
MADGLNGRGMLPPGWALATVGDLAEYVNRGKAPSYTDNSGIPIINQRCVRWGGVDFQHLKFTTVESFNKTDARQRLRDGDVLWNSTGTGTIGRAAVFQSASEYPNITVDTHVTIIRPSNYHPTLLRHWIFSDFVQKKLDRLQAGSTNQVELSRAAVLGAEIAMPPLAEQHRIVAKIEELFGEIEAGEQELGKAREGLEVYRRAVLKAAVTGELTREWREKNAPNETGADLLKRVLAERRVAWERAELAKLKTNGRIPSGGAWRSRYVEPSPLNPTKLPDLPRGWTWASLKQLGDFGRGKSRHRPRNDPTLYGGAYPFLQTGDVRRSGGQITEYEQTYNDRGLAQSRLWPAGTVCITIAANIAASGILTFDACFPDSVVGLVPQNQNMGQYIEFFVRTARDRLDRFAPATAQKNINLETLESLCIPLPPSAELVEIVQQVSSQLDMAADADREITLDLNSGSRLRQSILAAAFSGKLVPQDPADEPASMLLERLKAAQAEASASKRQLRRAVV